jgi:hypothetical protein
VKAAALAALLLAAPAPVPHRKVVWHPPLPILFETEFREVCGPRWVDRAAQLYNESPWDPLVLSFDGGEGLGQATRIWPVYIQRGWVPPDSSPYEPKPAIMGAHRYMLTLEAQLGGWVPGYCGYNAGAGSVIKAQMLAKMAGLPGANLPGSPVFLQTLPQVTKAASRWTINYHANIQKIRALYKAKGLG